MKVIDIKVMRGPNRWSNYRKKLIVLKLDLEELEDFPTSKIGGFSERLEELLPSMYKHGCSEGHDGGFFERVKQGTWMGHVIEHIALEVQSLAGMECGYGRTRSTNIRGIYHVVFSYVHEKAGVYAAKSAIRIAEALIKNEAFDLEEELSELRYINKKMTFGPSTGAIVAEAEKRNIPYRRLNNASLVTFGYGNKQKKIRATITGETSGIGIEMAADKDETKSILSKAHIPVPKGILMVDEKELQNTIDTITFPVVIKPLDGNHGRGITTNITTIEDAIAAFNIAKKVSKYIIVEKFLNGSDYRFLVINYQLVSVAKRTPASVMGDGRSTVAQLIEKENENELRGEGHEKVMTKIYVDEITESILVKHALTLSSVIPVGEILFLKDTANMSTGGTSTDVTDSVHPFNKFMAERVARLLNLDICGIDVVANGVEMPLTNKNGGIVEVNACPGLRMHLSPAKGIARNVAEPIMQMMFPENENGRIPLVAITGTNGKTTTTRLTAHLMKHKGYKTGYTTSDGIYIQDHLITEGDCTGPASAETVLLDPTIDFAVLECARGGILRAGLGFDNCNISIVTNVTEDHLGLSDIHTIDELAKVKSVVVRSTFDNGYTILNADDDLVYRMRKIASCNVALFSMDANSERIKRHCEDGGLAAVVENGYLVVYKGKWKTNIEKIVNIPLTMEGKASCMIKNIMPATLAAIIEGMSADEIREGLKTFIPSASTTPGRMNIFNFKNFDVMIDYAHNTDGFYQLQQFMNEIKSPLKVGVLSATGDRRDEDIIKMGKLAAEIFDEIIIKHDYDLRGRTQESVTHFLMEGINSVKQMPVKIISDEVEAVQYAIEHAVKGAFITICADKIQHTIRQVTNAKDLEEEKNEVYSLPQLILTRTA
ncbi:MAG: cyanophycin synthetase [Bacteroidetes bacterium]|nr:cyanophycin synthetase [Bacteroidota bacterium]